MIGYIFAGVGALQLFSKKKEMCWSKGDTK